MLGLSVNGQRAFRARWPNANIETDIYPVGYVLSNAGVLPRSLPRYFLHQFGMAVW